jgi:hypothetical protein
VIVGRIGRDKRTDLATVNAMGNSVSVLLSKGKKRGYRPAREFPVGMNPRALADEDFNGDGRRDLAAANSDDDDVSVLAGDGKGGFGPPADFPVGDFPDALGRGDFNGDGGIDLAAANAGDDDVSVLLNKP